MSAKETLDAADRVKRDKRGRALAAMNHVGQIDEDNFEVYDPKTKLKAIVRRGAKGSGAVCTCLEFVEKSAGQANFRCEHMLAVIYHLRPPEEEIRGEQPALPAPDPTPFDAAPEPVPPAPAPAPPSFDHESSAANQEALVATLPGYKTAGEIVTELSARLPASVVRSDEDYSSVSWYDVADMLDQAAPGWGHKIEGVITAGAGAIVGVSIEIKGVSRGGLGVAESMSPKAVIGAEHSALKQAAQKFGLARYLARENDLRRQSTSEARREQDRVTLGQLDYLDSLSAKTGVDLDAFALEKYGVRRVERVTSEVASKIIDDLKSGRY